MPHRQLQLLPARAFPSSSSSRVHADYHRPTDDFDKADLEKAARVARVAYRLGWQVAQGREAPKKIESESREKDRPCGDEQVTRPARHDLLEPGEGPDAGRE